jgi:hypothetical protein
VDDNESGKQLIRREILISAEEMKRWRRIAVYGPVDGPHSGPGWHQAMGYAYTCLGFPLVELLSQLLQGRAMRPSATGNAMPSFPVHSGAQSSAALVISNPCCRSVASLATAAADAKALCRLPQQSNIFRSNNQLTSRSSARRFT